MVKQPARILIIEDEDLLREAYLKILSTHGFVVSGAANGEIALAELSKFQPDLILLDILMPRIDGVGFLEQAQLDKRYPHTKVIVFSNLSSQDKLNKIMNFGVLRHVLKASLSPKELVAEVEAALHDKPSRGRLD